MSIPAYWSADLLAVALSVHRRCNIQRHTEIVGKKATTLRSETQSISLRLSVY